jgi:hypothetical protein
MCPPSPVCSRTRSGRQAGAARHPVSRHRTPAAAGVLLHSPGMGREAGRDVHGRLGLAIAALRTDSVNADTLACRPFPLFPGRQEPRPPSAVASAGARCRGTPTPSYPSRWSTLTGGWSKTGRPNDPEAVRARHGGAHFKSSSSRRDSSAPSPSPAGPTQTGSNVASAMTSRTICGKSAGKRPRGHTPGSLARLLRR